MAKATQFGGRMRAFITKKASKPSADLTPVKRKNNQERGEWESWIRCGIAHTTAGSANRKETAQLEMSKPVQQMALNASRPPQ